MEQAIDEVVQRFRYAMNFIEVRSQVTLRCSRYYMPRPTPGCGHRLQLTVQRLLPGGFFRRLSEFLIQTSLSGLTQHQKTRNQYPKRDQDVTDVIHY